jgi:very-short-patch-repair endonuclease
MSENEVRVFELAKDVGLTSKELVALLKDSLGFPIEVKNQLSVVPGPIARLVRDTLLGPKAREAEALRKFSAPKRGEGGSPVHGRRIRPPRPRPPKRVDDGPEQRESASRAVASLLRSNREISRQDVQRLYREFPFLRTESTLETQIAEHNAAVKRAYDTMAASRRIAASKAPMRKALAKARKLLEAVDSEIGDDQMQRLFDIVPLDFWMLEYDGGNLDAETTKQFEAAKVFFLSPVAGRSFRERARRHNDRILQKRALTQLRSRRDKIESAVATRLGFLERSEYIPSRTAAELVEVFPSDIWATARNSSDLLGEEREFFTQAAVLLSNFVEEAEARNTEYIRPIRELLDQLENGLTLPRRWCSVCEASVEPRITDAYGSAVCNGIEGGTMCGTPLLPLFNDFGSEPRYMCLSALNDGTAHQSPLPISEVEEYMKHKLNAEPNIESGIWCIPCWEDGRGRGSRRHGRREMDERRMPVADDLVKRRVVEKKAFLRHLGATERRRWRDALDYYAAAGSTEPPFAERLFIEKALAQRDDGHPLLWVHQAVLLDLYIVDFFAPDARLVIEIDGWEHASDPKLGWDQVRDEHLASEGYVVRRIWNDRVLAMENDDISAAHLRDFVRNMFDEAAEALRGNEARA